MGKVLRVPHNLDYPIIKGEGFDINFANYLLQKDDNEEIKRKIDLLVNNKAISIANTGNTYRTINHWSSEGLIDDNRDDSKGWRKFNTKEVVWLTMIKKLRCFGVPISKIKTVKDYIIGTNEKHRKQRDIILEYYIVQAYVFKKEIKLIYLPDGSSDICNKLELDLGKILNPNIEYISISLTKIIEEITNKEIERKTDITLPLTKRELSLFEKIQKENTGTIEINLQDGKLKKFKTTNNESDVLENIKNINLSELIKQNKNSNINISTNDYGNISNIVIKK